MTNVMKAFAIDKNFVVIDPISVRYDPSGLPFLNGQSGSARFRQPEWNNEPPVSASLYRHVLGVERVVLACRTGTRHSCGHLQEAQSSGARFSGTSKRLLLCRKPRVTRQACLLSLARHRH